MDRIDKHNRAWPRKIIMHTQHGHSS